MFAFLKVKIIARFWYNILVNNGDYLSRGRRFAKIMYVRSARPQISLRTRTHSMSVMLLTEHHLEFLSLKGCYTGLSESTLVKMPHCLKSHVMAHLYYTINAVLS